MEKLLLLVSLSLLAYLYYDQSQQVSCDFELWKQKFGKLYSVEQEIYRKWIYQQNQEFINKHNTNQNKEYSMKENQFMDLTNEEFKMLYLQSMDIPSQENVIVEQNPNLSIDWRGITRVKDGGNCGSSWAFSAVGATESYYYVKRNIAIELSEQQLVDCDFNNYGCDGGYHNLALKFILQYGITTAEQYPYKGRQKACQYIGGEYKINQVQSISSSLLQSAVYEYPVSALVDGQNWRFYSSGVFSDCGTVVNHAILLVGFQQDGTWIIKNSWGTSWGENGYIRLKSGNTCGIASYSYRVI